MAKFRYQFNKVWFSFKQMKERFFHNNLNNRRILILWCLNYFSNILHWEIIKGINSTAGELQRIYLQLHLGTYYLTWLPWVLPGPLSAFSRASSAGLGGGDIRCEWNAKVKAFFGADGHGRASSQQPRRQRLLPIQQRHHRAPLLVHGLASLNWALAGCPRHGHSIRVPIVSTDAAGTTTRSFSSYTRLRPH